MAGDTKPLTASQARERHATVIARDGDLRINKKLLPRAIHIAQAELVADVNDPHHRTDETTFRVWQSRPNDMHGGFYVPGLTRDDVEAIAVGVAQHFTEAPRSFTVRREWVEDRVSATSPAYCQITISWHQPSAGAQEP